MIRYPTKIVCPTCKGAARRWTRDVPSMDRLLFVCVACVKMLREDGSTWYDPNDKPGGRR